MSLFLRRDSLPITPAGFFGTKKSKSGLCRIVLQYAPNSFFLQVGAWPRSHRDRTRHGKPKPIGPMCTRAPIGIWHRAKVHLLAACQLALGQSRFLAQGQFIFGRDYIE